MGWRMSRTIKFSQAGDDLGPCLGSPEYNKKYAVGRPPAPPPVPPPCRVINEDVVWSGPFLLCVTCVCFFGVGIYIGASIG